PLEAMLRSDYRAMVSIGLGCVVAMIAGLTLGRYAIERMRPPQGVRPKNALSFKTLLLVYAVLTATIGGIIEAAWDYGGLAQAIIALTYLRLGLVYLIARRLVRRGEWHYLAGLLVIEVVLGITGFYAGFREPLMMAFLAFLEFFDRRNLRHWAAVGVLGCAMVLLGIIWIGVRGEYRERYVMDEKFQNRTARIEAMVDAVHGWATQGSDDLWVNADRFVDRMWTIYYPALAVDRVPSVMPHTNGQLMLDTLRFTFMPRLLFPDKPNVKSDSELVRKYAGVMVAGEESNTDIAFGYAAESYIDFGVPLMFLPMFIWATFIGVACALISREYKHRDLAVAIVTVIGWMSLYLFERSWTKTIGLGGTLLIYAGGLCYVLDRLWFEKFRNLYSSGQLDASADMHQRPGSTPLQLQPNSK
ncbi:MAG TPA: hypothetical protein VLV86_23865, partial [Vicinamibacterales bacterium]|nr:hypothetical protein [Vicinamibacterales bacterium]